MVLGRTMVSMRHLPRTAGALSALVLLTACGASSDPAPASAPSPLARPDATAAPTSSGAAVTIDPTRLTRGPDPQLSWYDVGTHTLHHGTHATVVHVSGMVESLAAAGNSDLLVVTTPADRPEVVRVNGDGSTTVLARARYAAPYVVVSADGSTFAWVMGNRRQASVLIARTSDGHQVARRTFLNEQLDVLDLTADRALVRAYQHTTRWNLAQDTTEPISADTAVAASARGDLALRIEKTGRTYVTPASGGPAWSLPKHETANAFAPDGASILTGKVAAFDERGYDVYQQPLQVRDSATGAVRATFDGRFGWYDTGSPRWEDSDQFIVVARDPNYASGDATMRRAWVRCSVSRHACETAGPLETPKLDVPPYGPLERLVAGPAYR